MNHWARLDIGSHKRTRWQRLKHWIFGKPNAVHVTSEIAAGIVSGVTEDYVDQRRHVGMLVARR